MIIYVSHLHKIHQVPTPKYRSPVSHILLRFYKSLVLHRKWQAHNCVGCLIQVFSIWIFGRIWCSIWLAVDVWTCTASILHLVVISLDRYIAVTHPITYPNIMTSKRAKMLILAAWVLREFIAFTK